MDCHIQEESKERKSVVVVLEGAVGAYALLTRFYLTTLFMALGDITLYDAASFGYPGDDVYLTQANTTVINAGEPVAKALGQQYATALATNKPVVATDFLAGVAATTSTQTASANGVVRVTKMTSGSSWLIAPKVTATWDTQAEYDALEGARVLLDLTTGVYTILASDGSTSGCVVLALDIAKYPGKVRFAFRNATNFLS